MSDPLHHPLIVAWAETWAGACTPPLDAGEVLEWIAGTRAIPESVARAAVAIGVPFESWAKVAPSVILARFTARLVPLPDAMSTSPTHLPEAHDIRRRALAATAHEGDGKHPLLHWLGDRSVAMFAETLGVKRPTLQAYINGRRPIPRTLAQRIEAESGGVVALSAWPNARG